MKQPSKISREGAFAITETNLVEIKNKTTQSQIKNLKLFIGPVGIEPA